MAEVTSIRNNALPYPVYACAYTIVFPLLDADGDPISPSSPDSERSLNGDTFADCTNEATEIATSSGICYLTLTAAEMTADIVAVRIQSTGAKTTVVTLYPRKLAVLSTGTCQGSNDTGDIQLASGDSAVDDIYNGCLCVAVIDSTTEARIINDYVGSTKVGEVSPAWNTAQPDSNDTYTIYAPEGRSVVAANTTWWNSLATVALPLIPTTAGRTLDVSAGGEAGVDWANVGSPTTTLNLSGTTIATTQKVDVETIKTNAVANGGTITFPTNATLASTTNITAGTIATATNVTTVNGLAADVITAASIAAGAIDRATFAADTGLVTVRSNTAQAGGATTITLDASASATDSIYNYHLILLTGGTGAGQSRYITGYVGATKVATVASWQTNPDNTSTFAIIPGGQIPGATAPTAGEVADAVWDEAQSGHTSAGTFGRYLDAQVANVEADTQDIQNRIPAALVSGRIDASVGAMASGVLTATAIASDAITAAKIADGAIDAATFAAGAITAASIASDAITDAKVASDVTIASVTGAVGSVTANVNAVLANTAHGGTSATLRLGTSSSTPALYVTSSGGTAVRFSSSSLRGLQLDSSGGQGLYVESSATSIPAMEVAGVGTTSDGLVISGTGTSVVTGGFTLNGALTVSTNAIPWNAAWDAEVQSEAEDALAAVGVTTTVTGRIDAAITTRQISIWAAANSTVNLSGTTVKAVTDTVNADVVSISGDSAAADNAESYFDGVGYGEVLQRTTIATLASQTSFTLTAGSADNDSYNDCVIVIQDASTAAQKAVGVVDDYTGSSKTVTLRTDPAVFTMATTDLVTILADRALKPTVMNRTLDVTSTGAAGVDWANVEGSTTTLNLSGTTVKTATDIEADTQDIQSRLPAALVGGRIDANVGAISSDATAADNAEAFFDGTGYAGTNNVIPLVTTTTTATNVTTVNGLAAGVITAASIASDAITDAKVASDVTIASVTGAVGSVTARVTANVDQINTTSIAGTGSRVADAFVVMFNVASSTFTTASVNQTGDNYARLGAPAGASVSADVAAVKTDTGNLVTRITSTLFSGITSLAQWLGLLAGKQLGNSTARTEVRATGAGSGTFDETTDSTEAIRDRGDAAWVTATGFSTHSAADVWAAATRVLTAGTNLSIPTAAQNATAVWTTTTSSDFTTTSSPGKILVTQVGGTFTTTSSSVFSSAALANAGAGSAPTAAQNAAAVWDLATSGHTTASTFGALMAAAGSAGDPWITELPDDYAEGTAGYIIGAIGTGSATIANPLSADGLELTIRRGQSYPSPAIRWSQNSDPAWPALSGKTITVVTDLGVSFSATGAGTAPAQHITLVLTSAQTTALPVGPADWEVRITDGSGETLLEIGVQVTAL